MFHFNLFFVILFVIYVTAFQDPFEGFKYKLWKYGSHHPTCFTNIGREGLCDSWKSCRRNGGKPDGRCLEKYVCCVHVITGGNSSSANNTYFVNPEYSASSSSARHVSAMVNKINPQVTQMRVEFLEMELAPPNGDGLCNVDYFWIKGSPVPVICGNNTGQHVMLFVEDSNEPITFTILTSGNRQHRKWHLKIIQFESQHPLISPRGCLQYQTRMAGEILSFGYVQGVSNNSIIPVDYAVCFKRDPGFCGITLIAEKEFNLGNSSVDGNCHENFVQLVPGRISDGTYSNSRICGSDFKSVSIETKAPLILHVMILKNRGPGFRISYHLNPCLIV